MVRGDHRFSEKDSAYLVYEWQDSGGRSPLAGVGLPGYGTLGSSGTQHAVANWAHIFSPKWLSEIRVGYSRLKVLNLQEDYDVDVVNLLGIQGLTDVGKTPLNNGAPRFAITGFSVIGGGTSQPQGRAENTYHYVGIMKAPTPSKWAATTSASSSIRSIHPPVAAASASRAATPATRPPTCSSAYSFKPAAPSANRSVTLSCSPPVPTSRTIGKSPRALL